MFTNAGSSFPNRVHLPVVREFTTRFNFPIPTFAKHLQNYTAV